MSKRACKENNLALHSPKFIREWHPTKNGWLTPEDFCPYSNRKVWWLCKRDTTHAWEARIAPRHEGIGCPYCSGKVVTPQNCLATLKPGLAKEWHPTKNGALTPSDVTPGSDKKPGGYARGIKLTNGKLQFATERREAVALFAVLGWHYS
jgi:hypothetical protein